jgi:hypothetical protein
VPSIIRTLNAQLATSKTEKSRCFTDVYNRYYGYWRFVYVPEADGGVSLDFSYNDKRGWIKNHIFIAAESLSIAKRREQISCVELDATFNYFKPLKLCIPSVIIHNSYLPPEKQSASTPKAFQEATDKENEKVFDVATLGKQLKDPHKSFQRAKRHYLTSMFSMNQKLLLILSQTWIHF